MIYIYVAIVALLICSYTTRSLIEVMDFIEAQNEHYDRMCSLYHESQRDISRQRFNALMKAVDGNNDIKGE